MRDDFEREIYGTQHLDYDDVQKIDGIKYQNKIDLLVGGSPCQSFSFAGKMVGMATKDKIEITTLEQYLELKEKGV